MTEQEQIDLMRRCSNEIKQLRVQIGHLQPKADAYDNLAAVIRMFPRQSQGYGEDLAWMLDRKIEKMEMASEENTVAKVADEPHGEFQP